MGTRRQFLEKSLLFGAGSAFQCMLPAWAQSARLLADLPGMMAGTDFTLDINRMDRAVAGKSARPITLNGQFPAPLLRWREGDDLTLRVINHLSEATSIHWHGLLLPFHMDGVPGVSFPGIPAGSDFTYRFPVKQAGTYWYHSHSGLQEQLGNYGPIIIDPAGPDPVAYDREHVVMLSDWTFEDPHRVFSKLKKMSDNYNFQQRTIGEFFADVEEQGLDAALANRLMWGDMRMNPTDLADVTASTYTYLVNGHSPVENWTALFRPGERVRLRFINASAMSIFNVRIPGLPMTVVQADGLNVKPVETDEFQIGTAETFDVIVTPTEDRAFTIMCESNDRYGYGAATLAPRAGMRADIPPLRECPTLTMKDMGMSGMAMEEGMMTREDMASSAMDHSIKNNEDMDHAGMNHEAMSLSRMAMQTHDHPRGPGVMNVAMNPVNRLHERPLGLENVPHRVLVYTDLESLEANPDTRAPEREMELHLTSNMERYMWSFDGIKFSEVKDPILFHQGERLRLTLVNDTMMPHPIHIHGMFFDVVIDKATGMGREDHKPRKHTIVVKPGEN